MTQRKARLITLAFTLSLSLGCGGDAPRAGRVPNDVIAQDAAGPGAEADATPADDLVAPSDDAASGPDVAPEPGAPPNISEALDCGTQPPTGPGSARDLQRYELDTGTFPDAICNNGDPAVFFFRPYRGEANRNKWLISLYGGGGCSTGPSCAARWCGCRSTVAGAPNGCEFAEITTNFSAGNMNGDERGGVPHSGITLRGDPARPNPLGDWNHVRVVYCSSDLWSGTRRAAPLTARHPKTGEEVSFSVHFLGSRIIDAVLDVLRKEAGARARYTFGDGAELPDLDDAAEVILSGDSAGGAGVIANLDRVRDLLVAENAACQGAASCPLVVRGLIDAVVGPDRSRLDFSASALAEAGAGDSYADFIAMTAAGPDVNTGTLVDTSCASWHAANAPETAAACSDIMHVIRHHVTTPFFVRMALFDPVISSAYIDAKLKEPSVDQFFNLPVFARVLQQELSRFPDLGSTAEEKDAITVAPGVFAPGCTKHDTLHTSEEVYGTSIEKDGTEHRLFDVFERWRSGGSPQAVLTSRPDLGDTVCGSD